MDHKLRQTVDPQSTEDPHVLENELPNDAAARAVSPVEREQEIEFPASSALDHASPAPTESLVERPQELRQPDPSIPGYRIERVLGKGGMGIVFLATDLDLGRQVAIKTIRSESGSQEAGRRFLAEAQALAKLGHPHIVAIHASGQQTGSQWFAMEYLPKGSLHEMVKREPQDPVAAARLAMLIAKAVHAAHQAGIIHRDLKPHNILLAAPADEPALNCAWGWPKVSDFGLARLSAGNDSDGNGAQHTASGSILGTPQYMSPEQTRGVNVGPPADIYGVGAILYDLLTGSPPFSGPTSVDVLIAVCEKPLTAIRDRCPNVPESLAAICERCLEKDPAKRFVSAADLATSLQGWLEDKSNASGLPSEHRNSESQRIPINSRRRSFHSLLHEYRNGLTWAAAIAAGVGSIWYGMSPNRNRHQQSISVPIAAAASVPATTEKAPDPLRVVSLEVKHANGVIGKDRYFDIHLRDHVTIKAQLSRPAYVYILVCRADGQVEICYPESPTEVPEKTATPSYPSKSRDVEYELAEGTGLWVFALVARESPLPAYKDWLGGKKIPWQKEPCKPGQFWWDDGHWVETISATGISRAAGAVVPGKSTLVQLTTWLKANAQTETVSAIALPVIDPSNP